MMNAAVRKDTYPRETNEVRKDTYLGKLQYNFGKLQYNSGKLQ